jgi:hypothetical protein
MSKRNQSVETAVSPPATPSNVSIADILRKGNLSVGDPGPVTPPTARVSTGAPTVPSNNSSGGISTSSETHGK